MIRSQLFRNVGDEGLRKLERAISQTPSDIATARRFAVEWRRAGRTDWPRVLVAADRDDVTISATSASGGVLGWGAAGAASRAWPEIGQVGLGVRGVRVWMFRDAPDRIRIPRSLAEDWVGQ